MLYGGGVVALLILALWLYCIFDVISTQEGLTRNMPKPMWLLVVIFLPTVGSIAWLILGRPERAGFAPGDTNYRSAPDPRKPRLAPRGPEDSPEFMSRFGDRTQDLQKWEEDLRRREEELRRREEDDT